MKSNFGTYQKTKNIILRIRELQPNWDFNISEPYRTILIHKLNMAIQHLEDLHRELQKEDQKKGTGKFYWWETKK